MTLAGTIVHIYKGDLAGQWPTVLFLAAGVITGAQIGARISQRFKGALIVKLLAVAVALAGLRVAYQGLL